MSASEKDLLAGTVGAPPTAPGDSSSDPRERVLRIARKHKISDDIADDYLKLTGGAESGNRQYNASGGVLRGPKTKKTGAKAYGLGQVMGDSPGSHIRTVGGHRYDLRDPDQNMEAGLRYFHEGGDDPVGRRLHYFGGPGARAQYERTGKIPKGGDGYTSYAEYVRKSGGLTKRKPASPSSLEDDLASGTVLQHHADEDLSLGTVQAAPQSATTTPTAPDMVEQSPAPNVAVERPARNSQQLAAATTSYDTALNPDEEAAFQQWKQKNAPNDSGDDYDLRGAFKAGLQPDAKTGHWPDAFKKPNHPTFSNESQYAVGENAKLAGHWEGDKFIPAAIDETSQMQSVARRIPVKATRGRYAADTNTGLHVKQAPVQVTYNPSSAAIVEPGTRINPGPSKVAMAGVPPADVARTIQPGREYATAVDTGDTFDTSHTPRAIAARKREVQVRQANARRRQLIDQARQMWIAESDEAAKHAEPDLAKKITDAPRNASTADVVKYAKTRGLRRSDPAELERLFRLRGQFPIGHRNEFSRPLTIAEQSAMDDGPTIARNTEKLKKFFDQNHRLPTPAELHSIGIVRPAGAPDLHPQTEAEQIIDERIANKGPIAGAIAQQWPRFLSYTDQLGSKLAKLAGKVVTLPKVSDNSVFQEDVSSYLERRAQMWDEVGRDQPPNLSLPNKIIRQGINAGYDVARIAAMVEVSGMSLPTVMVGESLILHSDKDAKIQAQEAAKAYAFGWALSKLPVFAQRGVGQLPGAVGRVAVAHPEIVARTIGALSFGGLGGTEAYLSGGDKSDIAASTIAGGIVGGGLAGGGLGRIGKAIKGIPDAAVRAEWLPETVRNAAAKTKGYEPIIVADGEGNFAAGYVDPKTREHVHYEVVSEQRANELAGKRRIVPVKPEEFARAFGNEQSGGAEVAPMNRQLGTGEKSPTETPTAQKTATSSEAPTKESPVQSSTETELKTKTPATETATVKQPASESLERRFNERRTVGGVPPLGAQERRNRLARRVKTERASRRNAEREDQTDSLTGLANQKAWLKAKPAAEADPDTEVLSVDFNNFKAVNDTLGHTEGDKVLQEGAKAVREVAAQFNENRVFRSGGDELALLVPKGKAEAIRSRIEEGVGVLRKVGDAEVSVSVGRGQSLAEADSDLMPRKTARKGVAVYDRERVPAATAEEPRKFSSTQVELPEQDAKRIQGEGKRMIPDRDVYTDPADNSYGREERGHITVKYGVHDADDAAVRKLLADEGPIKGKLGKVSIFHGGPDTPYDTVKLDVLSPDLHRLNQKIAAGTKVTDTHPEYVPHVTIAYVKKGEGKKYVGMSMPNVTGREVTFNDVTFSSKNRTETTIPLGGQSDAAPFREPAQIKAEPAPPKKSSTGLHEAFKFMGGAISENLYRGMFDRMQKGKLPAPFPEENQPAFEQLAKKEYDAGRVKKWEDLWDLANPGKPAPTSEPTPSEPLSTAEEIWKAGKPVRLLNTDARLKNWETHDGVSYEIYNAGGQGIVRVFDEDSRNVVELIKYPKVSEAVVAYRKAVNGAKASVGSKKTEDFGSILDDELALMKSEDTAKRSTPNKPETKTVITETKAAVGEAGRGIAEISKGIMEIFKSGASGDRFGSGVVFDDETYERAKPYFIEGVKHFQKSGMSFADALRALLRYLRETANMALDEIAKMKPYIVRFMEDWTAGKINFETVDAKAHDAAHSPTNDLAEPTVPQQEAGNYQKGHVRVAGLNVSIENPEGSTRKGVDKNGKPWSIEMKSHYGYIRGYEGADGEHVDIFIRPGTPLDYNGPVFVINQTKGNGHLDEHKVMLGWETVGDATKAYLSNYTKGWNRYRDEVPAFPDVKSFREWLDNGDLKKVAESPETVETETNVGSVDNPNVPALARSFSEKFLAGTSFRTINDARKLASELLGGPVTAGTQAAKMVDEAVELGVVMAAREIVKAGRESHGLTLDMPSSETRAAEMFIYRDIVGLHARQPTLGVKTSTSVQNQAYSTPIPLAYVASRLAGITETSKVGEPTAGNGALLIDTKERNIVANELDPQRNSNLIALFPGADTIKRVDASDYPLAAAKTLDVVIANPPFGIVKEGGETKRFQVVERYNTAEIDHAIAMKSLEAMKDDGTAVLILGGINATDEAKRSTGYSGKAKLEFYVTLYGKYNVVDHFTVNGDLYKKQGAAWPVDVVVIHGRGKSARTLPAADVPRIYNSWDELEGVLDEPYRKLLDARRNEQRSQPQSARAPGSRSGQGDVSSKSGPRNVPGAAGGSTDIPVRAGSKPAAGVSGGDLQSGGRSRSAIDTGVSEPGRQRSDNGSELSTADLGTERVPAPTQHTGETTPIHAAESAGSAESVRRNRSGELDKQPARTPDQPRPLERADLSTAQAAYRPSSKARGLNTLVPLNMKASIEGALDKLVKRVGDLDNFVNRELGRDVTQHLSAEQVDALAMAIDNIQRDSGMIIGDQGGIGKGRVVAGVIDWGIKQDRVVIFVTEKPNLYKDIVRDLVDIGSGTIHDWATRALMTNSSENVPLDDDGNVVLKTNRESHTTKLHKLMMEGDLGEHDVIFTTYSQMQTIQGGKRTIRQDFLQQFGDGAVIIFDESHNAGGAEKKDLRNKQQKAAGPVLDRAIFARQLIANAYGVFYSSATYAKRPQVMDLYSKTDMSKAVENPKALAPAIEKGGVPLQQAVAAMLAEAGQYVRRERDLKGLVYETVELKVDRQKAENTSAAMRAIRAFDESKQEVVSGLDKEAKKLAKKITGSTGSTGDPGARSTNFTSLMHNLIGQMTLMLKVDGTVDEALKVLKADHKVVISVSNTMGSFIQHYVEENGLLPGDAMGLSFGDMLRRYLERSRDVSVGQAFGPRESHRLTDEELGPKGKRLYDEALKLIQDTNWDGMPVSPIDYIKHRLAQAGYETGEITGRQHVIQYKQRGTGDEHDMSYRMRPGKEVKISGRAKTLVDFNSGNIDALVINQAGSTGLSIHASSTFKDQRKRVMLIAQPELNIDTHMQMLYRIDRTGQVVKPAYKQLAGDIPAEKRPAAILSKKMASLNASTTAARGSAYEARDTPDFMNIYGDEVIASVMEDNPEVHAILGTPLHAKQTGTGLDPEEAARKVTGRIPLLPIAEQERIYEVIESEYTDLIQRLDAMGENALEAKTIDLDAKLLKRTEIFPSKGPSPFEQGAHAEESDVRRIGKPYTSDQVRSLLSKALGSEETAQDIATLERAGYKAATDLIRDVRVMFENYVIDAVDTIEDKDRAKAKDIQLRTAFQSLTGNLERLHVGASIRIDTPLGDMYGIVVKMEQKGQPKNPAAPGSWRATVVVADAMRAITLPLSKLHYHDDLLVPADELPPNQYVFQPERLATVRDRAAGKTVDVPVIEAFDLKQTQSREQRTILTGNLLAAFGRFQKGRIINFTDGEGQVRQGIMMPADFNLETAMKAEAVKFTQAEDIIKFLSDAPNSRLVNTSDNTLRLTWNHGSLRVATNASKATGAQYFLNKRILDAANDEFVKSGSNMQMFVSAGTARDVVNAILAEGFELETNSYKEEAKKVTAANPKNKPGQAGRVVLGGPRPTGYHTGPGRLRPLFDRIRNAATALRGSSPSVKKKFSVLGNLRDIWVGNLSQLEQANRRTFEAALRAAGAKTTGKMMMRRAANQVQHILQTKNGWDLFRSALVESRLRGVRDRWLNLRDLSQNLDDEELTEFYVGGGDDDSPGIRSLVAMLEGMPFGKQFKEEEGFNPDDSLVGMTDSLLATDDFNAARSYLAAVFGRAASSVASVMDPADFEQFTSSRLFGEALPVYKELLEAAMNEAHALNEGVFSDALGPLETYYPLTALDDKGEVMHRIATRVFRGSEYRPPDNPRNKMATGLSPDYDVTPEALGHAVSQAERRNTVANLLKVAEQQGLVQTLRRRDPAPPTINVLGEEYTAKTVQKGKDRTLFIDGKTIHVPAPRVVVPEWFYKELQPILEEGDYSQGNFAAVVSRLNLFGMAGPIDAAAHTANVIGALVVGTPYVGTDILSKTIGNTPVTKLMTTWVNLALTDPWTDDAVKDIEEMSKIGVIPSRYGTVTSGWLARGRAFAGQTGANKKYFSLAPLLYGPGGIDIRARLLFYRLAQEAMPNASVPELKRFIDQLGSYTFELHGAVEKFLKKWGIAPFYTAGSTMWRTGIKATFGMTPLPSSGESRGKRAVLRARMMLSGGIAGIIGLWVLMHKAYTGKWPWEDDRSRLLYVPLSDKHRHHWLADKIYGKNEKTAYVGMGFFSPLIERGLRSTGITAAYNAKLAKATNGQASEESEREIINSAVHPFTSGPVTHAGFVLATTKEPYISSLRDLTGRRAIELLPAMHTKEPGLSSWKSRGIESIAALNSFYSNVARNIGLVRETFDLDPGHSPKDKSGQPNPWLRMAIDLAAPRLIKGPTDLVKQRKRFIKNEKAIKATIRREEGLPAKKRRKQVGPAGPAAPQGPGGEP